MNWCWWHQSSILQGILNWRVFGIKAAVFCFFVAAGLSVFRYTKSKQIPSVEREKDLQVSRSTRNTSTVLGPAPQNGTESRTLEELLDIKNRLTTTLPNVGEPDFNDAPIRRFAAGLSLEETRLLFRYFEKVENDQIFPWKMALAGRWGELDAVGILEYLEPLAAESKERRESDDLYAIFERSIIDDYNREIYLSWGRTDFRAAWQDLPTRFGENRSGSLNDLEKALLKQFGEIRPKDVVSFLLTQADDHEGGWCRDDVLYFLLAELPQDAQFATIAESLRSVERGIAREYGILPESDTMIGSSEFKLEVERTLSIQSGPGAGLFESWSAIDPGSAVNWYLDQGIPITEPAERDQDSITKFFLNIEEDENQKAFEWLEQQLSGGPNQEIAQEMTLGIFRQHGVNDQSWMKRFALLSNRDDRFSVMRSAVAPVRVKRHLFGGSGSELRFSIEPVVSAERVEELLPRFNLTADQEAQIRANLKRYETKK